MLHPAVQYLFSLRKISPAAFRLLAVQINEHCTNVRNKDALMSQKEIVDLAGMANEATHPAFMDLLELGLICVKGETGGDWPIAELYLSPATLEAIAKCADPKGLEQAFDAFWAEYPNKNSKHNAQKAYLKAIQAGVKPETMLEALPHYKNYLEKTGVAAAYGATWINGRRWADPQINPEAEKTKLTLEPLKLGHAENDALWAQVADHFASFDTRRSDGIIKFNAHFKDVGLCQIYGGTAELGFNMKNPHHKMKWITQNYTDRLQRAFAKAGVRIETIEMKGLVI